MTLCKCCGEEFKSVSIKQKYCGGECRSTAYGIYKKVSATCLGCNKEYIKNSLIRLYCSTKCRNATYGRRYRDNPTGHKTNVSRGKSIENYLAALARCSLRRRRGHEFSLTLQDLLLLYELQGGKCAVTGLDMTRVVGEGHVRTNVSLDRIDSSIGYVIGNVRLVCCIVNLMKHTMTDSELLLWCKNITKGIEGNIK